MINRQKILVYTISILVGQLFAVAAWYFFNENFFVAMMVSSILVATVGWKQKKLDLSDLV
jgi:hypothetical protein